MNRQLFIGIGVVSLGLVTAGWIVVHADAPERGECKVTTAQLPAVGNEKNTGFVVIDPGHGGVDPGTRSHDMDEKTITLKVTRDMVPLLKRDRIKYVLTRDCDKYVSLSRRVEIANRPGARLLMSIHCDYFKQHGMDGFTILYAQGASPDSRLAAHLVAVGLIHDGFICHAVRRDTRGLEVIDKSKGPAVLVELGFMSDPHDLHYLTSKSGRHRLAAGLVYGLENYLQKTK
ncbi:MAG: N-acetylmuramoyl-L-alanine amidase [Planctomycetia bacterium]|jgi:N-acetylmuramoyl-L-alanine amidase|nr:N-acetylmuramoyl-L-alanine amidase [Planctomycetia bacterium]